LYTPDLISAWKKCGHAVRLDETSMANAAKWMAEISGVSRAFGAVAEGVYPPYGDRSTTYILVNFSKTQQMTVLPVTFTDIWRRERPDRRRCRFMGLRCCGRLKNKREVIPMTPA
jgi:hypothetical protein